MPDDKEAEFCREAVAFLGADTSAESFQDFIATNAWDPGKDGKNSSTLLWHHYKSLVDMGHIDASQIPKDVKRRVKQTPNFFRKKWEHQPVLVNLLLESACSDWNLLPPDNWKELWHTNNQILNIKSSTEPKLVQTVAPSLGSNSKQVIGSISVKGRTEVLSEGVSDSTKPKLSTLKRVKRPKTMCKSSESTVFPSLKKKVVPLLKLMTSNPDESKEKSRKVNNNQASKFVTFKKVNRNTLPKYKRKRKVQPFKERKSIKKKKIPQEELFEVERIVDMRLTASGEKEFFVKWKGFDESESSWETEKNCINCELAIKQFFNNI